MLDQLRGSIPADHYWRKDIASREIEAVFAPSWICVGFTDDLKNHNDYITTEVGAYSIVVQNFHGVLKAFRNNCSHRFSRIQTAACGNRSLTCPYHGWSYDLQGVPIGIPQNNTQFKIYDCDREKLALRRYDLETCGRFVFMRMSDSGTSLRNFLGRVYDDLAHFSEICTERIASTRTVVEVNWKIGYENAAEGYHIPMAHKGSLGTSLEKDLEVEFIGKHSVFYRSLSKDSLRWWQLAIKTLNMSPSTLFPDSTNYVIFPNSIILATCGASFVYQTYEPLDANRYCLKSTYWMPKFKSGPTSKYIMDSLIEYSERIMQEDQAVCENVQSGIRDAGQQFALLGKVENRVAHFQTAYEQHMRSAPAKSL